ncbi:mitochondrial fission ELM1 family protein [Pseudolysobacter antarcticus]|uniref:mitochondrial fission ELM1 family protein n=1 Tax=Pseudolysobacter antarcticus TaxID=2511995 RepID=UPI001F5DAB92|nr:mitochondrial fission ELM1 family protein [Pseudolysobacter antarcticus]
MTNVLISDTSTCWVISDGAAGNERQALALADAMAMTARIWRLQLRAPWSWFAPRLTWGATLALPAELRETLRAPWPQIAIGCGRHAALALRVLRERSAGKTFCVQILDPRIAPRHFDLVITPQHDQLVGRNVLTSLGALNPIDDAWLNDAARKFDHLRALPTPRTAIVIGASNRAQTLDRDYFDALLVRLSAVHQRDGGSFLVSTSRRTPSDIAVYLRKMFVQFPGVFWASAADGENPYAGFLAHATRIVVTPDSVNMLSEACASGKPVLTFVRQPLRGKLASLHANLRAAGYLQDLEAGTTILPAPAEPLRETAGIAAKVLRAWRGAQSSSDDAKK